MPYVTQMRVAGSRTVTPRQYESARAEREVTVSFEPGELKTNDGETIRKYAREFAELVKAELDSALGFSVGEVYDTADKPTAQDVKKETPQGGLSGGGQSAMGWPDEVCCTTCDPEKKKPIKVRTNSRGNPMAICNGCHSFLDSKGKPGNKVTPSK